MVVDDGFSHVTRSSKVIRAQEPFYLSAVCFIPVICLLSQLWSCWLHLKSLLVHLIQSVLDRSVGLGVKRSGELGNRVIFRFAVGEGQRKALFEARVLCQQALILFNHLQKCFL